VIFDFDNTLVAGDTFLAFMLYLFVRSPLRWVVAIVFSPVFVLLFFLPDGLRRSTSLALWFATLGWSERRFRQVIERYVDQYYGHKIHFYASGLTRLQQHIQQGDEVFIATGCARLLVEQILKKQLLEVPVIGSELVFKYQGVWCSQHCFGRKKLAMLMKNTIKNIDLAYSDSAHDYPLLQAASQPVLVNPNSRTIARCADLKEGAGPEILNWD